MGSPADNPRERRSDFLLAMYSELWNSINRHILVVWQSIGVLIGSFAIFTLAEKQIMPIDIAVSLIILIYGWLIAHLLDASYWYNRNLAIISNIERQFLDKKDLKAIHPYFESVKPTNRMITHLQIQFAFGRAIAFLVLLFHITTRVIPVVKDRSTVGLAFFAPYIILVIVIVLLARLRRQRNESYRELVAKAPGVEVFNDDNGSAATDTTD